MPAAGRGYSTPGLLNTVLIRSVIDDQLRDNAQISCMRCVKERAEIIESAEIGIDVEVIGYVISVVP